MRCKKYTFFMAYLLSAFFSPINVSIGFSYSFKKDSYQPILEFSLKGGHQRTLGRAGALMPLQSSESGLWFTQLWGLWDSDAAKEWNVGLGYRHELADWIVGAYGFFDRRLSALNHYHSQLTVGAELLGEYLEARLNGYIPTTAAKAIGTSVLDKANRVSLVLASLLEKPLGGMDIEVGGTLTPCKTLQGFLTYYHFNGRGVKAIDGMRIRAQLQLTHYVALTGEASYDRQRKESWFVGMQLSSRLGGAKKSVKLSQKIAQMVVRDIDVIIDYTKEKAHQHRNATYPLQKTHSDSAFMGQDASLIEIKAFSAASSVRDKIQSIVIFSPKDIRLKPRTFDSLKSMDTQLISVPCYDIQGISALEYLSAFVEQGYWTITYIGQGYGIRVHARGLGGGDREPPAKRACLRNTSPISASSSHLVNAQTVSSSFSNNSPKAPLIIDNRPSDYMHGLMAKDVYRGSQIKKKNIVTLNGEQWKIRCTQLGENDYFGALYLNTSTNRLVLAHRGTKPLANWIINLDNIVMNMELRTLEAYDLLKDSVKLAKKKGYSLSVTGHSLGGFLAELSVFVAKNILDYSSISGVTFDSPGARDFTEKHYKNNIPEHDGNLVHTPYDIIGYVPYPNIINTVNRHWGSLYMLPVQLKVEDSIWSKLIQQSETSSGYYHIATHSLDALLATFEAQSIPPRRQYMLDYPLMDEDNKLMAQAPGWWSRVKQLYTTATQELLGSSSKQRLIVFEYYEPALMDNKGYITYELSPGALEDIEDALRLAYGAKFRIDEILSHPHTLPLKHVEPTLRDYLERFWAIYQHVLMQPTGKVQLKEAWEKEQLPASLVALLTSFQLIEHQHMKVVTTEMDSSDVFRQQLAQALAQYPEQAQALLQSALFSSNRPTCKVLESFGVDIQRARGNAVERIIPEGAEYIPVNPAVEEAIRQGKAHIDYKGAYSVTIKDSYDNQLTARIIEKKVASVEAECSSSPRSHFHVGDNANVFINADNNCIGMLASGKQVFKPKALGIRPSTNPQFVARKNSQGKDVLELLNDRLNASKTSLAIQVITGMGGLGKTQLAVEYMRQTESDYDGMFWVQAGTIPVNYTSFIEALAIDLKAVRPDELVQTIHKSLMHRDYHKVLWVYDDVQNAKVFNETLFNNTIKSIWDQAKTKVDIVITSRYRNNWKRWDTIELKLFTTEETQAYVDSFFKKEPFSFPKPSKENIEQLNTLLGGLPLAIVQAVDYLRNKQDGTGIAEYIEAYQANHHQKEWLTHSIEDLDDYDKTIWTTWNMSRKCLSKEADLLLQMSCFLCNDNISKLLFSPLWEDKVHSIAKELADYSLIKLNKDLHSFNIHVLLQNVLKLQQDEKSSVFDQVFDLAEQAEELFDEKESNTWDRAKRWLPHISSILAWIKDSEEKAVIFNYWDWGDIAHFFGDYKEAKNYYTQTLALKKNYYGQDCIELVDTLNSLGDVELDLGRYEAAKNYFSQALALCKHHDGEGNAHMASSLLGLGNVELQLEHDEIAKNYYIKTLAIKVSYYGDNHVENSSVLNNLGNVESNLGHYETAKEYYSRALALKSSHYGKDHIEVAKPLQNLGSVETNLGHYEEAKNYYTEALALYKRHYGKDHIEVAGTLIGFGDVEFDLGHYEVAKDYYSQALALETRHYGEDHIGIVKILMKLGYIESDLGRYEVAKDYYSQALALETHHYGEGHIEMVKVLIKLGAVESDLGHYGVAKDYYSQALTLKTCHYGEDHIKLSNVLNNLGEVESDLGHYERAKDYYGKALALKTRYYGEEHIEIAKILHDLGNIEFDLGYYKIAKDYLEKALAVKIRYCKEEKYVAVTDILLMECGNIELKLGHYESAKNYYSQALALTIRYYGQEHIELTDAFIGLGEACQKLGEDKDAKYFAEKALKIQRKHYGSKHIKLTEIYNLFGCIFLDEKNIEKAFNYYQAALEISETCCQSEHIKFVESLIGLGKACLEKNSLNLALTYYSRALAAQEKCYGSDHAKMLDVLKELVNIYQKLNESNEAELYLKRIKTIEKREAS